MAATGPLTHLNLARGFRGGERQTELLIRGLAAGGWVQRLVVRTGASLGARCADVPGLEVREAGWGVAGACRALAGAGLVHSHEGRGVQAAWLNRRLRRVPYLITRRVQQGPSHTWHSRLLYRQALTVVALSDAIRRSLSALDPALPVRVIPSASSALAVDPERVSELRRRFGGTFIAGHVGALVDAHKGQRQIITLARRLQARTPDVRFVLVGSGRDEAALRGAAAGLDNVIFTGQVEAVGDCLAAFDVFLYPSRHEGLGSILLDALEHGLPVVATRVGGIPEIIGDGRNGFLCPVDDPDALEEALLALHRDPALRLRFAAENHRRAAAFSPAVMTERYVALYRELADRHTLALQSPPQVSSRSGK